MVTVNSICIQHQARLQLQLNVPVQMVLNTLASQEYLVPLLVSKTVETIADLLQKMDAKNWLDGMYSNTFQPVRDVES